jgi:hypothetical protein
MLAELKLDNELPIVVIRPAYDEEEYQALLKYEDNAALQRACYNHRVEFLFETSAEAEKGLERAEAWIAQLPQQFAWERERLVFGFKS